MKLSGTCLLFSFFRTVRLSLFPGLILFNIFCCSCAAELNGNETIVFKTKYFERVFEAGPKGFITTSFDALPHGNELFASATENEGMVTINGAKYVIGGDGSPFSYSSHNFVEKEGAKRLEVIFASGKPLPAGVELKIVYENPADATVLTKWITIHNNSDFAVYLNGMQVEAFVPDVSGPSSLMLENDYVRGAMTVNGENARSPWIEKQHLYVESLLNTEPAATCFAYPVELDRWLKAGDSFTSFKVYEVIAPTGNEELRSIAFRKATRKMFPWTSIRHLHCALAPSNDVNDYYEGIDTAAAAGYEAVLLAHAWIGDKQSSPLFTNYSDYIPRPEIFPNGWDDIKKLTDYGHKKGLKMSFYSLYVNTFSKNPKAQQDNNWLLLWAKDDKSSRWGPTFDPATDWGPYVNRKMEETMKRGGFDSWHLDGPYYGDVCVAQNHSHKPGCNQLLAWERLTGWYQRQRALGYHGEAAQGFCAYPHGMSRVTTTGYEEGDFGKLGMKGQILATRLGAYKFTKVYRPAQAVTFVPVMPWSPRKDAPSLVPMEEKAKLYNAYISFCFGYGFGGRVHQRVAFEGPKSKAAITRWTSFWKDHADYFFKGFLLHLREPDGEHIDAIAHYLVDGDTKKLLVVAYNPLDDEQSDELSLPFAVVPEGTWEAVCESGQKQTVDNGKLKVTVGGMDATWYEMVFSKMN